MIINQNILYDVILKFDCLHTSKSFTAKNHNLIVKIKNYTNKYKEI